jgi:hypothetical protein
MQPLAGPKRAHAAYYQLKLGKGFLKQFSKAIGKDIKGECFGDCNSLQTPNISSCTANNTQRREGT